MSDEPRGSLHAEVLYGAGVPTSATRPAALRQTWLCPRGAVALYYYDFGSGAEATSAVEFMSASLWGGPGPTAEHPDLIFTLPPGGLVVVVSGQPQPILSAALVLMARRKMKRYAGAQGVPVTRSAGIDLMGVARRLRGPLQCEKKDSEWKGYCDALDRWPAGKPYLGPRLGLAGRSVLATVARAPVEEASFLVIDPKGVKYGTIKPENDEERGQVRDLLALLRGGKPVPPTNPVQAYGSSLTQRPLPPADLVDNAQHYRSSNDGFVRDCGDTIVVLESDGSTPGLYIGIFRKPAAK